MMNSYCLLVFLCSIVIVLLGNRVDFWKWLILVLFCVVNICNVVGKVCSVV